MIVYSYLYTKFQALKNVRSEVGSGIRSEWGHFGGGLPGKPVVGDRLRIMITFVYHTTNE